MRVLVAGATGAVGRPLVTALLDAGHRVGVLTRSPEAAEVLRTRGVEAHVADALDGEAVRAAARSFDAVMLVSMLHHMEDPAAALAEARRILRPGGRLAVMLFTREDLEDLWFADYFPSTEAWMAASHPPLAELLRQLPGARRLPIVFEDLRDASIAALAAHPELVLEEHWRRQTSFFERLERDHPGELSAGLERLAGDLAAGRDPDRRGGATVLAWAKPAD